MKVITYQSPNGATINLTHDQISALEQHGFWPKDLRGDEYCGVYRGLHYGSAAAGGSTDVGRIIVAATDQ